MILQQLGLIKITIIQKLKVQGFLKTRQQKLPTRLIAHQSASAHATERIKVKWGWGWNEITQLMKHLH